MFNFEYLKPLLISGMSTGRTPLSDSADVAAVQILMG